MVFQNTSGEPFTLSKDGERAAYAFDVRPVPKVQRSVSPRLAKAFLDQRTAIWEIVIQNTGLAYKALQILQYYGDMEEMVHEHGIPCLLRCVESFDSTKAAFSTYAMKSLIRTFLRQIKKLRATQHQPIYGYEKPYYENPELDSKDTVQYILSCLSKHDRMLLVLRYYKELTLREMADVAGVGLSTMHKLMTQAQGRARRLL